MNSFIFLPNTICNQFCAANEGSVFLGQRWLITHSTCISITLLPLLILTILCLIYFALLLALQVYLLFKLALFFVALPGLMPVALASQETGKRTLAPMLFSPTL